MSRRIVLFRLLAIAAAALFVAAFASGPALAASTSGPVRAALIPADVLDRIAALPPEVGTRSCRARGVDLTQIEAIEPVTRIEGFTSRMSNRSEVAGTDETERFVAGFGAQAVRALATSDDGLKERLVRLLAKWATAGALLKSESCVTKNGSIISTGKCAEWRKRDGSDLSSMKDATFSTFNAFGLVRAYHVALAGAAPDALAAEHKAIQAWIGKVALRLKRPNQVYFGLNMGWYWPAITLDLVAGRQKQAEQRLRTLQKGLINLINDDGSITERTTRGDRALWYHYTSIGEIVISMELMRAAGLAVSPRLETKLHGAVDLFMAAIADERVLHKWAKQRHNSSYVDEKQDWDWGWWPNQTFAGSWLHIYPYRYPDRAAAQELRRLVPVTAGSATNDTDFGIGIGCLYNAAAGLGEAAPEAAPLAFEHVSMTPQWTVATSDGFFVLLRKVTVGQHPIPTLTFTVIADYREDSKSPDLIELLRISAATAGLVDKTSQTADFAECGEIAAQSGQIRLHFGEEEANNSCVLAKLGPSDRALWSAVHAKFPEILDALAAGGSEYARKLKAVYAMKAK